MGSRPELGARMLKRIKWRLVAFVAVRVVGLSLMLWAMVNLTLFVYDMGGAGRPYVGLAVLVAGSVTLTVMLVLLAGIEDKIKGE